MNGVIELLISRLSIFVDKPINDVTISEMVCELQKVTHEDIKQAITQEFKK